MLGFGLTAIKFTKKNTDGNGTTASKTLFKPLNPNINRCAHGKRKRISSVSGQKNQKNMA
jgi:hypothetical protein